MSKHDFYKHVVAGTKSEKGFAMIPQDCAAELLKDGLVEVNPEAVDANGNIAARALNTAIEVHPEILVKETKQHRTFDIATGIVPAAIVRPPLPAREELYPFSKLEVGQSFYLAGEMKKYISTVTAANRRFAVPDVEGKMKTNRKGEIVPVLVPTRKFVLRGVTAGQTYEGSTFVEPAYGTRIFRIA
jgi:hypothetical protein